MRPSVRGLDDSESYTRAEPARLFEHVLRRNWWCNFDGTSERRDASASQGRNETLALVYRNESVPFPEFLGADERAQAEREIAALAKLGARRTTSPMRQSNGRAPGRATSTPRRR